MRIQPAARALFVLALKSGVVRIRIGGILRPSPRLYGRILRLGIPDLLVPHGTRAQQLAGLGLTPEGLAASIGAWVATTQPVLP